MLSKISANRSSFLLLILLAAVAIRLPAAFYLGDEVTVLPAIHDQVSYDALARSLLAGRGYSFAENWYPFIQANTPTAHWSFVYPLYLAGVYALTGYHPLVARILQGIVAGVLTTLLVYLIGRRLVDETTGLVAAGLAAVYGYFIYFNVALMTESFFIIFVLYSLYLSLQLKANPTLGRWVLLGLALGVAGLFRQTILFFVPFLLLWLFWERRGRAGLWQFGVPLVVVALLLAPWVVRNYRAYGEFPLLNSNAGYALYASTNPSLEADWRNELVVIPVPDELRGENEAVLNRELTQRAIEFILADPQRYLLLTLDKTLEYIKFWPSADSHPLSNVVRVLSFGVYLPFMLLGLYLSLRDWPRFLPLYLFMLVHTAIHLLSWPAIRYRLPVDAVLMVFAAMALLEVARQVATWRKLSPVYAGLHRSDIEQAGPDMGRTK